MRTRGLLMTITVLLAQFLWILVKPLIWYRTTSSLPSWLPLAFIHLTWPSYTVTLETGPRREDRRCYFRCYCYLQGCTSGIGFRAPLFCPTMLMIINGDLAIASRWFDDNKLVLNPERNVSVLFFQKAILVIFPLVFMMCRFQS